MTRPGARTPLLPGVALVALAAIGCASSGGPPARPLEDPTVGPELRRQAAEIVAGATSDRERAVRIYEFVRDEIEYGFTARFDAADPLFTLRTGRGHCNPQTALFVALARAADLEARQRFVSISDEVLDGVWPKRAPRSGVLDHSYAEVRLDGEWLRVDGYTLDEPLYRAALARLRSEGLDAGFGAHRDSCRVWDGRSDCMAQFADPAMLQPDGDHGPFEDPTVYYESEGYTQRLTGLTRMLYRVFGMKMMNRTLDRLRSEEGPPAEETRIAAGASD